MNTVSGVGVALAVAGVVGYAAGVLAPYPGREFSLTALMVGVTVLAVGRSDTAEGDG